MPEINVNRSFQKIVLGVSNTEYYEVQYIQVQINAMLNNVDPRQRPDGTSAVATNCSKTR